MVFLSFGHLGVDDEDVTRRAFRQTLELWPLAQPILFTRRTALTLAADATRGGTTTTAVARVSLTQALGAIVSDATRAALDVIDGFPTNMKVAFLCVRVFGIPGDQVAAILVVKEGTVRAHLEKAKKKLERSGIDDRELAHDLDQLNRS